MGAGMLTVDDPPTHLDGARIPERAVEMGMCSQLWQAEGLGSLEEDGEQGDFPE